MNRILKALPLPIAGVMLALAALGNLLKPYGVEVRYTLGALSAILFVLLTAKVVMYPASVRKALDTPPVSGVLATYPMGMMILSTYAPNAFGKALWWCGVGIHLALMVVFTAKYIARFNLMKLFPSTFVMYVGIVCATVAAPVHGLNTYGQLAFWFGLVAYAVLLPLISYRVLLKKQIPEPALPTLGIFAAPASLLLAGYQIGFAEKSPLLVQVLTILALFMYVATFLGTFKYLKLKFMPSFSGFTFPFVISAIALKPLSMKVAYFAPIHNFMMIWATLMVAFVLLGYVRLVLKSPETAQSNA